jgi:hypothetical protein
MKIKIIIDSRYTITDNDDSVNEDDELLLSSITNTLKPSICPDIQDFISFPKNELMISSKDDNTLYSQPPRKSPDARKIWKSAKIPTLAYKYDIEFLLLNWAYKYAYLEINNKKIDKIIWKLKNKSKCQSTWQCFLQWILCASVS